MAGALETVHQFAERDVALHGDDVGTMHHDVGDAALVQAEDVAQHGALDRGEAGVVGRRRIEHDLEIVAHRSGLPAEQRADGAQQPAIGGRAHDLAGRHHGGQIGRVARIVVNRL
jgi:hypothetical protein